MSDETEARLVGEIYRSKSRATGAVVVMVDATQEGSGYDKEQGRWVAVCLNHRQAYQYPTRRDGFAQFPLVTWCPECRAIAEEKGFTVKEWTPEAKAKPFRKEKEPAADAKPKRGAKKAVADIHAETEAVIARTAEDGRPENTDGADEAPTGEAQTAAEAEAEALPV